MSEEKMKGSLSLELQKKSVGQHQASSPRPHR